MENTNEYKIPSATVDTISSGSLDSNSVGVNGIISGIPYSRFQSQIIFTVLL